jgi:tetratricopeptide (TPR) repeat protein
MEGVSVMLSTVYEWKDQANLEPDWLYKLAEYNFQIGKFARAEELFLQVLDHPVQKLDPEMTVSALEHLGLIATRKKHYEKALHYFQLALNKIGS